MARGQSGSLFLSPYDSFIHYFTPVYPDAIQAEGLFHIEQICSIKCRNSRACLGIVKNAAGQDTRASRALRLANSGAFSTEVDDHKKVGDLPAAFPKRAIWADILRSSGQTETSLTMTTPLNRETWSTRPSSI
jgi:hypothetical protein